jgi:hypothetical protein
MHGCRKEAETNSSTTGNHKKHHENILEATWAIEAPIYENSM